MPANTSQDYSLPKGAEMFTVRQLAKICGTSHQHWINLIESGTIPAVDLRSPGKTKSMLRVPRAALISFLDKQGT
jgi:hypothetical protein